MAGWGGDRRWWWLLGALALLGFALRVAGARGGLWLDEAWSAVLAHDAGTPLGIFLNINHDNNHHLNSLWLQFVGLGANPLVARAPSIVTGTAGILVAGLIGHRRAPLLGLVAAGLFAVSPMLVTLGSEARGYAPMALALLVAILLADRWLAGGTERSPATALALCFFLGALSQLTIVFGFCALAGWIFFTLWRRSTPHSAAIDTAKLLLPSAIALGAVLAIVFGAAAASPTGFQFGRYDPFAWIPFLGANGRMIAYALGIPFLSAWLVLLAPLLVLLGLRMGVSRFALAVLAILGFPAGLALLHVGNTGYARYYLVAALVLLLLIAELLWLGLREGGWRRWLAAIMLAAIVAGSLIQDIDLARNLRGDPAAALAAIEARSADGTVVMLDRPTGRALLEAALAPGSYPLAIVEKSCDPANFLFLDRFQGEPFPAAVTRCGRRYVVAAQGRARGLSGTDWTLYAYQP